MKSVSDSGKIQIERYKYEPFWLAAVFILSIILWILLVVTVIGIIYAAFIAVFFFLSHLGFIAYIRGSAVRIGPNQFPELWERVQYLSKRAGLHKTPETYIMQAGGTLNALATKLFGSNFIILYSDLLEACGEDDKARDMIIGHEIGHIREGHLSILWFILPGLLFPFIGTAYSRAREFTCDRYGAALCENKSSALKGLAILAAGPQYGPKINLQSFVLQQHDLNNGLMTIGKWLSTHPPLSERIHALEPNIIPGKISNFKGNMRAALAVAFFGIAPILLTVWVVKFFAKTIEESQARLEQTQASGIRSSQVRRNAERFLMNKVEDDFRTISDLLEEYKNKNGTYPSEEDNGLSTAWLTLRRGQAIPKDPFDGKTYGYYLIEGGYVLWSSGPDGLENTDDDIVFRSTEN